MRLVPTDKFLLLQEPGTLTKIIVIDLLAGTVVANLDITEISAQQKGANAALAKK